MPTNCLLPTFSSSCRAPAVKQDTEEMLAALCIITVLSIPGNTLPHAGERHRRRSSSLGSSSEQRIDDFKQLSYTTSLVRCHSEKPSDAVPHPKPEYDYTPVSQRDGANYIHIRFYERGFVIILNDTPKTEYTIMKNFIIASVAVSFVFAAPSTRTGSVNPTDGFAPFIAEANEAKKEMASLTQEERDAISKMFEILSDSATTGAQKMAKIDELVKDAPQETQAEVHAMAQTSTQLSDWFVVRLKQEQDPVVPKVATALVDLMLNMDFIMSSDAEKTAKVQIIVKDLTPAQIAALEQLDKDTTAEEKRLGMDTDK